MHVRGWVGAPCRYDYTGYGCAEGGFRPSESRACADIEAVYNYATSTLGIKPDNIVLYGRSMGTLGDRGLHATVFPHRVCASTSPQPCHHAVPNAHRCTASQPATWDALCCDSSDFLMAVSCRLGSDLLPGIQGPSSRRNPRVAAAVCDAGRDSTVPTCPVLLLPL